MDENSVETLCDLADLYITQQDYEKCEYNHLQSCVKYTAPVYHDMCDFVVHVREFSSSAGLAIANPLCIFTKPKCNQYIFIIIPHISLLIMITKL